MFVFCIMFFGQIVIAGTSSQDEVQDKQIRIIAVELNKIGNNVEEISKKIQVLEGKISEIESKFVASIQDSTDCEKSKKISIKIDENANIISQIQKKQELLFKTLAKIEIKDTDSSKEVITPIDDKTIIMINKDIADLKKNIDEIKSLLDSKIEEEIKVVTKVKFVPSNLYQDAMENFNNKKYKQAITQYKALLNGHNVKLRDNAQYWIAECYYALGDYNQSIAEFEKVFTYDDTDKYDDTQLKLGYCYKKLGNKQRAIEEFERLIQYYPQSEYKNTALKQLSILN